MESPPRPLEEDVKLSHNAMPLVQRLKVLQECRDYFHHFLKFSIGFQANVVPSFSQNEELSSDSNTSNVHLSNHLEGVSSVFHDLWKMHINNRGEPFESNGYVLVTKDMEVAILEYFAKLWRLEKSESCDDIIRGYWGYVTTLGATEANILALCNARDYLSGLKPLHYKQQETEEVNKVCVTKTSDNKSYIENGNEKISDNVFTPVVFYSQEAYFGHAKALCMLRMMSFNDLGSGLFPCPLKYPDDYPSIFSEELLDQNGWPYTVPCNEDDTMHIPSLIKLVEAFVSRGYPPIVIFTSGTTSTGAYDNPQEAIKLLVPILKRHNMYQRRVYCSKDSTKFETRNGFWFHVDAALGGSNLPFLEMAIQQGLVDNMFSNGFPVFDFRIPEVASISMSIYKWLVGLPFPAAVYMIRREYELQPLSIPVSEQKLDNTLCGSRAGHGVLLTWEFLARTSHDDLIAEIVRAENLILFLIRKLQELEDVHGKDLWITRSPGSLIVSFKRPKEEILFKYSLPCFLRLIRVQNEGKNTLERRNCVRISIMPNVQLQYLEMILEELKEPGAFPNTETSFDS